MQVLSPFFWALLVMATVPVLIECAVIIYLVVRFSLEDRGFLAFSMGICAVIFLVFSSIFVRGGILLSLKEEGKKRSVRSLIWGFSVMMRACFVFYVLKFNAQDTKARICLFT